MRKTQTARPNQVRIIGGMFRSRKLTFPTLPGLRPTGDRIRETLFNWLAPHIIGSRCLDLFAGSGALGMEALSRGAAQVIFIDASAQACEALRHNLDLLDRNLLASGQAQVICANSLRWINTGSNSTGSGFNIIFLDPPFADNLHQACSNALDASKLLAPDCLIYIEEAREQAPLSLPSHWQIAKTRSAGNIRFQLFQRQ